MCIRDRGNSSSITTPQLSSDDNGASFVAFLKKICNATFQNNFSGGIITAGGISGNSPQVRQVVKQNTITVTAQQLYENYNNSGLDYSFSNWDGGSTSLSKTFTIYNHEQHTANYIRKANTSQVFEWDFTNVAVGNSIRLTWNEHPNTNVTQYKIWRRDKNGTESYIGTVNRGTTSFTDYDYQYASENDPDKGTLFYNVSVYCSLDGGSWSSDGMKLVTGVEGLMKENLATNTNNLLPTEYKIDNYPNPFNPATTIKYQLPKAGIVTIKVYDILGKEAATLVNEIKPAGYYSVNFDGRELTSGIYIATIQVNNFIQSKKMLLVK
jgi:plastocyanin